MKWCASLSLSTPHAPRATRCGGATARSSCSASQADVPAAVGEPCRCPLHRLPTRPHDRLPTEFDQAELFHLTPGGSFPPGAKASFASFPLVWPAAIGRHARSLSAFMLVFPKDRHRAALGLSRKADLRQRRNPLGVGCSRLRLFETVRRRRAG